MNLKRSPFSILNKERREIDYIKGVYKRKIQAEIESYKDPEDEIREIQFKLKMYWCLIESQFNFHLLIRRSKILLLIK